MGPIRCPYHGPTSGHGIRCAAGRSCYDEAISLQTKHLVFHGTAGLGGGCDTPHPRNPADNILASLALAEWHAMWRHDQGQPNEARLHGGDVVAIHKQLCLDHAGRGASIYETLIEHMVCCLNRAIRPAHTRACPLSAMSKCCTARHTDERCEFWVSRLA